MKKHTATEILNSLIEKNEVLLIESCPVEATDSGETMLYTQQGKCYWKGEEQEFDNPSIEVHYVNYLLPVFELAKSRNKDIIVIL